MMDQESETQQENKKDDSADKQSKTNHSTVVELISAAFTFSSIVVKSILFTFFKLFYTPCERRLKGEVVLITGGGRGLGRSIALEIARKKPSQVVLWGRHRESLEATAKAVRSHHVCCSYMICDVSNRQQVHTRAKELKLYIGKVTVLINNAGIIHGKNFFESDDDEIRQTIDTNLMGHIWTMKSFLPDMMEMNHGYIVSVNSIAGLSGLPGAAYYSASKYGLTGLYETLFSEISHSGKNGISFTSVYPSLINTDMFYGCHIRFPWLFGALNKEDVAARVVKAMLKRETYVVLPRIMYIFVLIKHLVPTEALMVLEKVCGVSKCMANFHQHTEAHLKEETVATLPKICHPKKLVRQNTLPQRANQRAQLTRQRTTDL